MGSILGPTLANTFSVYHKRNRLARCPLEYKPFYYPKCVDDIFVLFNSREHLKRFQSFLNFRHINISFTIENEKDNGMFFLDINIICDQGKFTTSIYCQPTLSGIYTYFDSFFPSNYKIDTIHTLLYRCFRISSDWTKFQLEFVKFLSSLS